GKLIRNELQNIDLDSVPFMMTLGGQSFANAFDSVYSEVAGGQAIQAQPFFENALQGSSYCNGFANCTSAVASKQASNIKNVALYNLWSALPFNFGNSLISQQQANSITMATSLGWGNYNAAIVSLTSQNYHGLTV